MPKIRITNLNNQQLTVTGNSARVLDIIHRHHIDWMHSCGKKGRCVTCKMTVVAGMENISERTRPEQKYADMGLLTADQRLACQCTLLGDIVIKVPDQYKLPHVTYTD